MKKPPRNHIVRGAKSFRLRNGRQGEGMSRTSLCRLDTHLCPSAHPPLYSKQECQCLPESCEPFQQIHASGLPPPRGLSHPATPSLHSASFLGCVAVKMVLFTCPFRCLLSDPTTPSLCRQQGGRRSVCHIDLPEDGQHSPKVRSGWPGAPPERGLWDSTLLLISCVSMHKSLTLSVPQQAQP